MQSRSRPQAFTRVRDGGTVHADESVRVLRGPGEGLPTKGRRLVRTAAPVCPCRCGGAQGRAGTATMCFLKPISAAGAPTAWPTSWLR